MPKVTTNEILRAILDKLDLLTNAIENKPSMSLKESQIKQELNQLTYAQGNSKVKESGKATVTITGIVIARKDYVKGEKPDGYPHTMLVNLSDSEKAKIDKLNA